MPRRPVLSRARLVDAARSDIEAHGADALSLRRVARALGVTAPALYAHIADRDDLLAAVAGQHFEALVARFDAVDVDDPVDRVRALCRAYVDHALSSPSLFRLMFRYPPAPVEGVVDAFPPSARAFEVASAATAAAIEAGQLRTEDPLMASLTMWAAVHGVAEVLLLGFGFDDATADALVRSTIETVLAGQRPLAPDAP